MKQKICDSEGKMKNNGRKRHEEVKCCSGSGGLELEKVTLRYRQGCSFRQAGSRAVTAST